ncbi:transglutaminase domain-containing protein [uncultured Methanobrevibacter sp.]|uniref:transglutaminase domain-containing protein n=1 Tax=uncultured Methanobrevibacter sp. TaxID=253161 RepID=UPI0026054AA6|nr:Ig-like domain repeat protein [uncultured Methanobrevibacter sp.]
MLGAVSAIDSTDVSNYEDSNLDDDALALSTQDKLEISNEDSISETNSHDDNLEDYPSDIMGSQNSGSDNEDNDGNLEASNSEINETNDTLAVSSDNGADASLSTSISVSGSSSQSEVLTAEGDVPSILSIANTTYSSSGAVFRVILKSDSGFPLSGQKVTLKINGATYTGATNKKGVVLFKTNISSRGTYTADLSYGGNSKYAKSSLTQKVKVLHSVVGSDLEKVYGVTSVFQASFYKNDVALANTEVSFKIGKKTYKRVTDSNGVAKLNVGLFPGKYTIESYNPYSKETVKNTIVVKKDNTTVKQTYAKPYILPNHKHTFNVLVKSANNVPVKNAKVTFKYDGKVVTAMTNDDGKASIIITAGSKLGTHNITYKFGGNDYFKASNGSGEFIVHNPVYSFKSYDVEMKYDDGSNFGVILLDNHGDPLTDKTIKIKINGKTYERVTNANGWAGLSIGKLKPGTYSVVCSYLSSGAVYFTDCTNKLNILKLDATVYSSNLIKDYGDAEKYKAIIKDENGKPLKNSKIKLTINGKSYVHKTNSSGVATWGINLGVGKYPVKVVLADDYYKSETNSRNVIINGTKFVASNKEIRYGNKFDYSVKVVDGFNKPIKNAVITFKIGNANLKATSNSDGIAKVKIGILSQGSHTITFTHGKFSGSANINVVNTITIKDIIAASKTVKNYIVDNEKLPSSVKIGGSTFTVAQYLHLASQAIIKLKSGDKSNVVIKNVKDPKLPRAPNDLGNLYTYVDVAKRIVYYERTSGVMPDFARSDLGNIGYGSLVYESARVLAFYGDHGSMPSYVSITTLKDSSSSSSGLNTKNTIKNLAAYLAATTNCQVNNAKVQALVKELTAGLTSDKAKAKAIFNYVRDTVSYSFYYDTRYGAVGTLNAKTGNCVDHAHAVIALYRAADLPARYVHGTCTFSSGGTYGHVWAQVLIGDTWTVSDATSSRNSLGYVANWNTNSYSLHGYYAGIEF